MWAMRRTWLLSPLIVAMIAAATAMPVPRAHAQDILGLMTAPLRIMRNLGIHGRVFHHRRARAASRTREPREREAPRETVRTVPTAYWPSAPDDLFGFAFAAAGANDFWTHGPYDILTAAMAPGAKQSRRTAKAAPTNACSDESGGAEQTAVELYGAIERQIAPTAEQQDLLKDLRTALVTAYQRIGSACAPGYAGAPASDRLDLLADRLWAMRQAMLIVRTPLARVYDLLSAEQKARLDGTDPHEINCSADLAAAQAWRNGCRPRVRASRCRPRWRDSMQPASASTPCSTRPALSDARLAASMPRSAISRKRGCARSDGGSAARVPPTFRARSMIPKSGHRFLEKIMLQQRAGAG